MRYLDRFINYEKLSHYNYKKAHRLNRIKRSLKFLDNPQDKFPSVIIAGTKGKGSTAAILTAILTEARIKTGLFTSPHLISVRERIKIGQDPISGAEFSREISLIKKAIDKNTLQELTYFEVLTTLAFLYFAREGVDLAVLEVGLGGRLDATNVVHPLAACITPIGYDHTHLLGDSIEEIAGEKCGVIKKGTFVVSSPQSGRALGVIEKTVREKKASLLSVGKDITYKNLRASLSGATFDLKTPYSSYQNLSLSLPGRHQVINSLAALGVAEILKGHFGFKIEEADIRTGLKAVRVQGSFQIVSKRPNLILDSAHNQLSAESLKEAFKSFFKKKKCLLILGISSDKDIEGIGKILAPLAESVIFTRALTPRAAEPSVLARRLGRFFRNYYLSYDVKDALTFAKGMVDKKGIILVTGSLFLVADALRDLANKEILTNKVEP